MRPILCGGSTVILALAVAGAALADDPAPVDATPTANDAEFARYMEKALAAKAAKPEAKAPAPAASCQAGAKRAEVLASLRDVEIDLARLRQQQQAKWAEKGWTAKEAAAAGEPVVLNGSGYNIQNSIRP